MRNRVIFAGVIIGILLTAVLVPSALAAQPLLPCQEGSLVNCEIPPHGTLGQIVKVGNGPAASTGVGAGVGLNVHLGVTVEPTITPLPTPTVTPLPTPTVTPLPTVTVQPKVTVIVPLARNSTTVIMPPLAPAPGITTDTLPVTH